MQLRSHRRTIRLAAAGIATAMALIYFGIGTGVLQVGSAQGADDGFLLIFGASAGGAFLLGAVLLSSLDRRWLWVLGALFQVFVVFGYLAASTTRVPTFEVWGITLRVLQLPLLAALIHLAVTPPEERQVPQLIRRGGARR